MNRNDINNLAFIYESTSITPAKIYLIEQIITAIQDNPSLINEGFFDKIKDIGKNLTGTVKKGWENVRNVMPAVGTMVGTALGGPAGGAIGGNIGNLFTKGASTPGGSSSGAGGSSSSGGGLDFLKNIFSSITGGESPSSVATPGINPQAGGTPSSTSSNPLDTLKQALGNLDQNTLQQILQALQGSTSA